MTPQARSGGSTDASGTAQGRFTVQLPSELRPMIDTLGKHATASVKEQLGIDVELSNAQVVTGIIKAQHDVIVRRQAEQTAAEQAEQAPSES